jgi:hypothetical protein
MTVESNYIPGDIPNTLKNIEDENVLQIISLSCASNDLASNLEALGKFPQKESMYFFYNSISIIREIAKLVKDLSASKLKKYFFDNTETYFNNLEYILTPFDDRSLSKSVLKPIRDINFHYNFPDLESDSKISMLITELKNLDSLSVGKKPKDDKISPIRYTFADWFRNEYINNYLDETLVKQISTISADIVFFVDSLLFDLTKK